MRYRLDVVAPSVAEAVRYAGGWMFDRVMAGWDVNVLLASDTDRDGDVRPLKILGAEPVDFESVVAAGDDQPHPQALAVAAGLIDRDERVREGVRRALDQGVTEVARGQDLFSATPIHVVLQRLLGLPTPRYHHHRLIRDETGKRLAKRDEARAIRQFRAEGRSPEDIRAMVGL